MKMNISPELFAELESCKYLFLRELEEQNGSRLRVLVQEASAREEVVSRCVAGTLITGLHPVTSDDRSRVFEILWNSYVAYLVTNESFARCDAPDELRVGQMMRVYSKSHFLEYIKHSTQASDEYPGHLFHFALVCENHIVDVVATEAPQVRRIKPRDTVH